MSLKLGSLKITSPAFGPGGVIPKRFGGDGENKSPPFVWSGAPSGTQQFVLIAHDPDAPLPDGFTHWVLYGIPPETKGLPEGQGTAQYVSGLNGMGKQGYMGPYPPSGHGPHHYYFWLYALDIKSGLKPNLNRSQLLEAIKGHILEQARLVGTYER